MIQVNDVTIEKVIESFDDEQQYLSALAEMFTEQLSLKSFLDHENYTLLTPEEFSLLTYLSTILYTSAKIKLQKKPELSPKLLENYEEENWAAFNSASSKSFTTILDNFFENYEQEDMLALVEDAIQPDDEKTVTSVGAEIIFVACKSIIDSLHKLN
ncbi:MAG: hypothetical protein IPM42_01865 [Saprospiraceae bacterium]|nr:hypothetical protein [Saprospiraceae bacterium]